MTARFNAFIFLFVFATSYASFAQKTHDTHLQIIAFDFDDTIMSTNDHVYIYHKSTGETLRISTRDYAEVKLLIGKPGPYQDYEYREPREKFSFREIRRPFTESVNDTLTNKQEKEWQGPSFHFFQDALLKISEPSEIYIVSAREQEPESIKEGLDLLVELGYLPRSLNIENLIFVGGSAWRHLNRPSHELKNLAHTQIIEKLEKKRQALKRKNKTATYHFLDDDHQNIEAAEDLFIKLSAKYPYILFIIDYVGSAKPGLPFYQVKMQNGKIIETNCEALL